MELVNQIDETLCFNNNNIRIIGTTEQPWFVAKDICKILDIKNVSMGLDKIPETWKGIKVIDTIGGNQDMLIINESGLYMLIMRSNKPIAQKFQEYVCKEILPSIRKTGEYKMKKLLEEKEQEKLQLLEEKNKLEKKYVKKPKEIIKDRNVVYLITTEEGEKSREYAIGKAMDLSKRKEDYNENKIHDFKIIYYISCKSSKHMDMLESIILAKLGKYRNKAGRDVFLLPESNDISLFIDVFTECLDFFDVEEEDIIYPKRTLTKMDKEKQKEKNKKYKEENNKKIKEQQKQSYAINIEFKRKLSQIYCKENREKVAKDNKTNYEKHREERKESASEHYYNNKEVILEERKEYYENNKEVILDERSKYYEENYESKIAPKRQALEVCECGMTVTHYGMKKHQKSKSHQRLMEQKENNDGIDNEDLPRDKQRTECECGMIVSRPNLLRHTKSDRHRRLMEKKKLSCRN